MNLICPFPAASNARQLNILVDLQGKSAEEDSHRLADRSQGLEEDRLFLVVVDLAGSHLVGDIAADHTVLEVGHHIDQEADLHILLLVVVVLLELTRLSCHMKSRYYRVAT